jgi:NAD-dependent deacetylase
MGPGRSVLFLTGAGLSADSGLPTYRGVGGLYDDRPDPGGISIERALSGPMFAARPGLTWGKLLQIERACRGASPNRGHEVIAAIEAHPDFPRVVVITQNVDGLHGAAGSRHVIDLHGDLHELICTSCGWRRSVATFEGLPALPRCPDCGAVIRPDVVLFGEFLAPEKVRAMREELDRGFDLVFSVGTSGQFPYVQDPVLRAIAGGVPTVEINPGVTPLSEVVCHRIPSRAAEALDALWTRYLARRQG